MTVQQAFDLALQHHQSGRLAEAEALYRQILAVEPRCAEALHLLGVIAQQVGRNDLAVELIGQAIALQPHSPEAHSNLGIALRNEGRLDEAIASCRQATLLKPNYPEAHSNLGNALRDRGQFAEAIASCRQAILLNPNYPEPHNNLGNALRDTGQLDEAIASYRQAIFRKPDYPEAHNNLGNALRDRGQLDEAIASCRQAILRKPDYAEAHSNLGNALRDRGQLDEAIASCRQAILLKPDFPEPHNNLGNALRDRGQLNEAIASYRQAILLKPDYPEPHNNLGNALRDTGQLDEAIASCRQAILLKPHYPEAHSNLGNALRDRGQLDEAIASYRQVVLLKPGYPEAHSNLGNALTGSGQLDEAIASYRHAILLKPGYPEAHSNLGNALRETGQLDEAIAFCRQAILLKPDFPEAHSNLGNALKDTGQLDEAIASYRQAILHKPDYPEAYSNLGNALTDNGQLDEAITSYRQAILLKPDYPEVHSNLLFTLNYHPGFDPAAVYEEHCRWNRQHAEPLWRFIQAHGNDPAPERRLRIGYVSPDFREHPVSHFLLPLLARHDHEHFEIFCYAQVPAPDGMTQQLRDHADHWHSLTGLSDPQAADLIRRNQINILVDLSGHTSRNRLLVFAYQPAPIQATWLGYPNTTGLTTMDYRLTDAYADPPGLTESWHSEQLVRLPKCAWCYQPSDSPPVTIRNEGPITFGSFNNFAKITEPTLLLWARILHVVPESRLLLKTRALNSENTRQRVRQILGEAGIGAERLELRGYEPAHDDHLGLYQRIDVALDTFPYHGTTTTCEAMWMGVPVVTLAGQTHASRVGASLLTNIGLPEMVADTPEEYVRLAADLAGDPPRLAHLRSTLRQRMEQSPLMDAPRFARDMEAAYRAMWRQWCAKETAK